MDASNANWFAYLALLLWVPTSLALFAILRPPVAAAVAYLAAALFLPERVQFDLPAIPSLTKHTLTSLCVLAGCLWRYRGQLASARPGRGLDLLTLVLVISAFGTAVTNRDALHYGPTTLTALTLYDAFSIAIRDVLTIGIPFFIGRALYRDRESVNLLFLILIAAGAIYTAFILVELRFSPQWHKWIYGFHQHYFGQTHRNGGWRPMVFMQHGLAVGLFILTAAVSATSLWRQRQRQRLAGIGTWVYAAWLTLVLVLCKSTAAIVYGLILLPAAAFLRARTQMHVAVALAAIVVTYPTLRAYDLFPTATMTSWAASVSQERAHSLDFRFRHEDSLLTKAKERLSFGWGGYRRNRIFDEEGRDRSVTDGFWILQLGIRGVPGFLAAFGLLLIPVFLARRRMRSASTAVRWQLAGLSLVVIAHAIDLVPNGLFSNLPFFLAGALAGAVSGTDDSATAESTTTSEPPSKVRAPESFY